MWAVLYKHSTCRLNSVLKIYNVNNKDVGGKYNEHFNAVKNKSVKTNFCNH